MGTNISFAQARRAEQVISDIIDAKDAKYPPIGRPCGTPGAVYSITVHGRVLGCTVELPFGIDAALPESAKEEMKAALHDAVLPIVERFYRRVWIETIAGKVIDGDSEPMPARWEMLFTKWLKNVFLRGGFAHVDGHKCFSEGGLPEAYRW